MLTRYLLLFACLLVSVRVIIQLYVSLLKNEILILPTENRPSNRRVSYASKKVSVGTAKAKTTSTLSTPRRTSSRSNLNRDTSYASYRSNNRVIR